MDLLEIMRQRRSVRSYTSEDVGEENIRKILEAGLLSASGRAIRPWELIVVKERAVLQKMAERVSQVMKLQGQTGFCRAGERTGSCRPAREKRPGKKVKD